MGRDEREAFDSRRVSSGEFGRDARAPVAFGRDEPVDAECRRQLGPRDGDALETPDDLNSAVAEEVRLSFSPLSL